MKVVWSWLDLLYLIAIMIISVPLIVTLAVKCSEPIVTLDDDKSKVYFSESGMGTAIKLGYEPQVDVVKEGGSYKPKIIEDERVLWFEDEPSYTGMEVLMSMYLSDVNTPEPRGVGFADKSSTIEKGNAVVIRLTPSFYGMNTSKTLAVLKHDIKSGNRYLADHLDNKWFNRLVYVPGDTFVGKGIESAWYFYHSDKAVEEVN